METKRMKKICKDYGFEIYYQKIHDPGWSIVNPISKHGNDMQNKFIRELSEQEFIRYMDRLKNTSQ